MEDSMEVVPSAENGNVPAEEIAPLAPSEQPKEETPAKVETTVEPTVPEVVEELFETPDGRKVDAATLQREWKDNFYPEYTRKSQALAELEKGNTINKAPEKPYENPEWQPQSWQEAISIAKQEALAEIQATEQAKIAQQQQIENAVVEQLNEIRKEDPALNDNALFLHATKYGFRDLKAAHQNMKDMSEMAKKVQTTTATNIAKRNDPVSVSPGSSGGSRPDPSSFGNAIEFLRALK